MKRLKQQFATYKISSAIREIGFDEECIAWYNSSSEDSLSMCDVFGLLVDKCSEDFIKNSDGEYVAAPTWSQLIDWFREKHGLYINIEPKFNKDWEFSIFNLNDGLLFGNKSLYINKELNYYEAHKQAIIKAIELCKNNL